MAEEDKKNKNKKETSWTCRLRSQTCCTHEKKKRRDIVQQRTVYRTVYGTVYRTVHSTGYSTAYSTVCSTVKWSLCLWRCTLAVLAIDVCVFFAYKTSQSANKNKSMKNKTIHQNDVICFRSDDEKNPMQ